MHIHQKSTQFSNGIKVLLFILITYTSWCNALSDDEVREAVRIVEQESMTPLRYCGRKLTQMMKMVCRKEVKGLLTSQFPLEKKSSELFLIFVMIKNDLDKYFINTFYYRSFEMQGEF